MSLRPWQIPGHRDPFRGLDVDAQFLGGRMSWANFPWEGISISKVGRFQKVQRLEMFDRRDKR